MENTLNPGDRVTFSIQGSTRPKPHGAAVVTMIYRGQPLFRTEHPLPAGAVMTEITKIEKGTK